MKNFLTALLFPVVLFSCSGSEKPEKKDITTSKTEKHINVGGTRVFLIPPSGFTASDAFQGFQKGENGLIQVMDINEGSYYSNAATFSAEEFKKTGATVHSFSRYKINNDSVKRIEMSTPQGERMISMVVGDSTYSVMFNCLWVAGDSAAGKAVRDMLNTVYYDKVFTPDPLANAAFTFDEGVSSFAFAQSAGGMYIYSIDGKKDVSGGEPIITILQTPSAPEINNETMQTVLLSKLKQYGMTNGAVITSANIVINGVPATETQYSATLNGSEKVLYLLTATAKGKMIAIQGVTEPNAEVLLQMITFAHSLRFK